MHLFPESRLPLPCSAMPPFSHSASPGLVSELISLDLDAAARPQSLAYPHIQASSKKKSNDSACQLEKALTPSVDTASQKFSIAEYYSTLSHTSCRRQSTHCSSSWRRLSHQAWYCFYFRLYIYERTQREISNNSAKKTTSTHPRTRKHTGETRSHTNAVNSTAGMIATVRSRASRVVSLECGRRGNLGRSQVIAIRDVDSLCCVLLNAENEMQLQPIRGRPRTGP